jgi:hypothetical protein
MTAHASTVAGAIAQRLSTPLLRDQAWQQSLSHGAAGVALLHAERARAGLDDWGPAHRWLQAAASADLIADHQAGLYFGAPAVAFALAAAPPRTYVRARAALDTAVNNLTRRRLREAHARIDRGELPYATEYDLISGLTGIGAHLLRRDPHGELLPSVLRYLARLTHSINIAGELLPGWWTRPDSKTPLSAHPEGHANLGMAHGITGPLALLALALRRGIAVDGHSAAINRICAWLDSWRQSTDAGPWWPQWITHRELRRGHLAQPRRGRPSWCYGTPGVARALQLAGIATGDTERRESAEAALLACLDDPRQLSHITDSGLCHGWAGLFQTTVRAAHDSHHPGLSCRAHRLLDRLLDSHWSADDTRLLDGAAGIGLAAQAGSEDAIRAATSWDTCLLLN